MSEELQDQNELELNAADAADDNAQPADPLEDAKAYLNRDKDADAPEESDDAEQDGTDEDADHEGEGDDGEDGAEASEGSTEEQPEPDDAEEDLAAMPEAVRERTRQRFEKMSQGYQEINQQLEQVSQEFEQVTQDHQALVGAITETGLDAQQFAGVLDLVSAINSTDPRDLQYAREKLSGQLREINVRLGDEETLLGTHPDLAEAVENLEITREHAVELAKARTQQQRGQQAPNRQPSRQAPPAPQQHAEPEIDITPQQVQRLNDLGASWKKSDMAFAQKWPILMERLDGLYQRTRPEAMEQAVQDEWDRIGKELGQAARQKRPPRQRPLSNRGTSTAQGAVDHKDPVEGAKAWLASR